MKDPIIRILGGPDVKSRPKLLQQPCTIAGLSRLTDVEAADLVVLYWDDAICRLPAESESFGAALSADFRRELQEHIRSRWADERKRAAEAAQLIAKAETLLAPLIRQASGDVWDDFVGKDSKVSDDWFLKSPRKSRSPAPNLPPAASGVPMTLCPRFLGDAMGDFMANLWTAVSNGGMAFVVIPELTNIRPVGGFTIRNVVGRLEIERAKELLPPTANPDLQRDCGETVNKMAEKLGDLIRQWPFRFGLRLSRASPFERRGKIDVQRLCQEYESPHDVHFLPAHVTRKGHANSLLLGFGNGALFVVPELRSLEELVQHLFYIRESVPPEGQLIAVQVSCDSQGRYLDFHSFRHTTNTLMARNGIGERIRMEVMRHSDAKLTNRVYVDSAQLPTASAMQSLPSITTGNAQSDAQPDAQTLVPVSLSECGPVISHEAGNQVEGLQNKGVSRDQSAEVVGSRNTENGSGDRARTCNILVNSQALYH
jgi:hypothetical protein